MQNHRGIGVKLLGVMPKAQIIDTGPLEPSLQHKAHSKPTAAKQLQQLSTKITPNQIHVHFSYAFGTSALLLCLGCLL